MKVEDFVYDLDESLIAQSPCEKRDESKLMILNRKDNTITHKKFKNIFEYLKPGDTLVLNNTKVIPARIYGKKETGANVEILLLKELSNNEWEIMVRPGNKVRVGHKLFFPNKEEAILECEIIEILESGTRRVRFKYNGIFNEILDSIGLMPLPPYITKELEDKSLYNTIYAKIEGSSAAPTAGLHFTKELLNEIKSIGVNIAYITLDVGIGTFRPVKVDNLEDHVMHTERFNITKENADIINKTKEKGGRIVAVGTTSCRVLESVADEHGIVKPVNNNTNLFIYPEYKFKCVDMLITNFHLPKSTLLMLVSAFYKRENIIDAYNLAMKEKYRVFSFGDAMLIY